MTIHRHGQAAPLPISDSRNKQFAPKQIQRLGGVLPASASTDGAID